METAIIGFASNIHKTMMRIGLTLSANQRMHDIIPDEYCSILEI